MKKILIYILCLLCISGYTFGQNTLVTFILQDIEQTNKTATIDQRISNYQKYSTKIDIIKTIDPQVKTALKKYLTAKINEAQQQTANNGLNDISNINQETIRTTRIKRHNTERTSKTLSPYTYELKLEQTATTRANHLSELNLSTHQRNKTDGYYNYDSIQQRFKNKGVSFSIEKKGAANFSENIGRRVISCKKTDCTQEVIDAMKKVFDFFMSEKKANGSHYKAIVAPQFTKIGIGIAINSATKKIFVVTHYSVNF